MKNKIPLHTYIVWIILFCLTLSIYPWAITSSWVSSAHLHGTIEIMAALFALCAAFVILARFFAIGEWLYLGIGLGFLIAGTEDLVHGVISLGELGGPFAGYEKFIPGTYVAGRSALIFMLIIAYIFQEKRRKISSIKREVLLYGLVALTAGLGLTIIATRLPLPQFIYPGKIISRPVDLLVGLIYLAVTFLYARLYLRQKNSFLWSIVASLILGTATQIYMVHSQKLYDAQFDLSHLMKIFSYIAPILGVGFATIFSYKKERLLTKNLQETTVSRDALAKEISERKKAEKRLRETESRLRSALLSSNTGTWKWDIISDQDTRGAAFNKILGLEQKDTTQPVEDFVKRIHPEDRSSVEAEMQRSVKERSIYKVEFRIVRPDGEIRWLSDRGETFCDDTGKASFMTGAVVDITEQKKLQEEKEKILYVLDERLKELHCLYGISKLTELPNISFKELLQKAILLIPPAWQYPDITCGRILFEDMDIRTANFKTTKWKQSRDIKVYEKKIGTVEVYYLEEKPQAYEGSFLKEEETLLNAITERLGRFIEQRESEEKLNKTLKEAIKSREITAKMLDENNQIRKKLEKSLEALKEAQSQLIQAEKMDAIGRMASGVAHEVKNPLGIIIQGINYFENELPLEQKDNREMIQMMKDSVKRADSIVRALLDFSRIGELRMGSEDINSILENSLALTEHKIKLKNIKIIKEFKKDLPKAQADRGKIEQVFINLLFNAIYAMSKGGKLYIRSYLSQLGKLGGKVGNRATDHFRPEEKAVIIEIEDTGVGISKENMTKIFDPFFTTKKRTEGTGLGLSVTKSLVEMNKGLIEIESVRGKGTKVIIVLRALGGE
ncbi:ATP-binding protein [Candidatus Omnitrophota bacterium]